MLSSGLGNPFEFNDFVSKSLEDVVWSSQITLAEIVNLLYCNFLFQKENQRLISSKRTEMRSATLGNEIDRCFLMAKVLESFATTKSSIYAGSRPIHNLKSWEYDAFYPQGLLAAGCQSALELAGHNEKVQEQAFEFGSCFTLAIKVRLMLIFNSFGTTKTSHSSFINILGFLQLLVALIVTIRKSGISLQLTSGKTLLNLDYNELNTILMNNAAMDEARRQLTAYVEKATNILEEFENFKNYEIIELLLKLVEH
ncbi:decaprenyl-diphosphate synthase subunit 2 [Caerostris extrusa]|uniref:Decaprenyl-diphosphate synthase subunit 2 n=1 Tax=Caerostris extrusa TaxID=172846 RepID=A0AAV4TUB3_CAEEX|nr:decaprenyl-diphosphate synthase subunit 2 [Caerostris extrusa]